MSEVVGDCIVRRGWEPDRGHFVEVEQADPIVAISRELLLGPHDPVNFVVRGDGQEVTICGQYVYRATGAFDEYRNPLYALTQEPGDDH